MRAFLRQYLDTDSNDPLVVPSPSSACDTQADGATVVFRVVSLNAATFHAVRGVRIVAFRVAGREASLTIQRRASGWEVASRNVVAFAVIATSPLWGCSVTVDGTDVSWEAALGQSERERYDADNATVRTLCKHHNAWAVCPEIDAHGEQMSPVYAGVKASETTPHRGLQLLGPMRQVFATPWQVVVGTQGSDEDTRALLDIGVRSGHGFPHGDHALQNHLPELRLPTWLHGWLC
eukprot:m.483407 g.483407  ORF g.483407 m.483407 type:complete len:235 (+) comp21727_c0_seq2:2205-2909(+)